MSVTPQEAGALMLKLREVAPDMFANIISIVKGFLRAMGVK